MKLTLYLDVLSLWCLYAMDAVERLAREMGPALEVAWRPAPIRGDHPLGYGREQNAYFYRRAEALTGQALDPRWLEGPLTGTREANLAAVAAAELGHPGLAVPAALMRAAMVEGRHVARRAVAIEVAAEATGLDPHALDDAMDDRRIIARLAAGNREMAALGAQVRPALLLENRIPDRAVLSGVWCYDAIAPLARAMQRDEERFLAYVAEHPEP